MLFQSDKLGRTWSDCSFSLGQIKNKCVSGNGSENFRKGRHTYFFFLETNIILCILKGNSPFKMHKIILKNPEKPEKSLGLTVLPVNLGRIGLS